MGLITYNYDDFKNKAIEVATAINLTLSNTNNKNGLNLMLGGLFVIAKIIYFEDQKKIGLSFNAEAYPEDVIHVYTAASKSIRGLVMLPSHYVDHKGREFIGQDAFAMREMDLEQHLMSMVHKRLEEDDENYMDYVRYVSKEPLVKGKASTDVLVKNLVKR